MIKLTFCGTFWHQSFRQRLSHPASIFLNDILQLRRGSLLSKYGVIALSFAYSGAFHIFVDIAGGVPPSRSGAFRFFVMQTGGIILEDIAMTLWKSARSGDGSRSKIQRSEVSTWQRMLGYVWVLLWFSVCQLLRIA